MKSNIIVAIFLVLSVVSAFLILIFRRNRAAAKSGKSNYILHILAPSVLAIVVCTVCLCGASWAWFTASITTGTARLQSASYTVSVKILQGEVEIPAKSENNGVFQFDIEAGSVYDITVTPTGTAASGYCKLKFENSEYYTGQLIGSPILFKATADQSGVLTFMPEWGTCAVADENNTVKYGETLFLQ